MEVAEANKERVREVLDHLLSSLNSYCEEHPEVEKIDVFMAVHNFHVVTVLDLERQAVVIGPQSQLYFRKVAIDTFKTALENKPPFRINK